MEKRLSFTVKSSRTGLTHRLTLRTLRRGGDATYVCR